MTQAIIRNKCRTCRHARADIEQQLLCLQIWSVIERCDLAVVLLPLLSMSQLNYKYSPILPQSRHQHPISLSRQSSLHLGEPIKIFSFRPSTASMQLTRFAVFSALAALAAAAPRHHQTTINKATSSASVLFQDPCWLVCWADTTTCPTGWVRIPSLRLSAPFPLSSRAPADLHPVLQKPRHSH